MNWRDLIIDSIVLAAIFAVTIGARIGANKMKLKAPPPTLKSIIDAIAAARGVTLYRESN